MNTTQNETQQAGLYLDNQQKVIGYARSHHAHMAECFANYKDHQTGETIKVDKVFDYLKEAFSLDGFQFLEGISGSNILVQENIERIEQLLERFYREFKKVPKEQFFFYRMTITEDEIADLIEFWIKTDENLFIEYEGTAAERATSVSNKNGQQHPKPTQKSPSAATTNQPGHDSNEFIGSEDAVAKMISNLLEEIRKKEATMSQTENELERIQLQASINRLKEEVQSIERNAKKPLLDRKHTEAVSQLNHSVSPSLKENAELRRANLHILFDYYSKQNHITGVKATFDRIEHQSNTINYPKLIHLLKDFNLLDEKAKVFPLFQKAAADYKALQLHEFELLMPQLAHVLITDANCSDAEKQEKFFHRIFSSEDHHARLNFKKKSKYHGTGKAFNTRESNDFRIRPEEITYQFHIIPHSGKSVDEIQDELVKRRQVKERYKNEVARQKEAANQKFLKKLSSIDPFNYSLVGLKNDEKQEHVAGINNLEVFRDASFNPKEFFKIPEDTEDDTFMAEYSMHGSVDIIKRSQHHESPRRDKLQESPRKQTQQTQQSQPLDSPRKDRAKSIVEEISARAVEMKKLQKSKNDSLMKNILHSQPQSRRQSLGGAPASEKSRRY